MSLHQTGFQEVLSAADLLGGYPEKLALDRLPAAPDLEDWGGPLTSPVRSRLSQAVELAALILRQWGAPCRRRAPAKPRPLLANDIDMKNYETGIASIRTGG